MREFMTLTPQTPRRTVATVTIVGRGRLGRATATALRAAGVTVHGPTRRGEAVVRADVVLLCVPDDQIALVAADVKGAADHVGHMSGATPLTADVDFGMHPLQTFVGAEGAEAFTGIGCAIAGRTPAALEIARELATRLGARPFPLADEDRAGYHTAASLASNFVVTLLDAAERVAATAGLAEPDARALLAPLVRSTVENWAHQGPEAALTGPVARGDERTVARQREALEVHAPEFVVLFDTLCERTRVLAARSRDAA